MKTLLIVCGALAREVLAIKEKNNWQVDVVAVASLLHNEPDKLPPAILNRITKARDEYQRILVVYGDCGTGGLLDKLLDKEGIERIAGPHCYEMYADGEFESIMSEAAGTFFLTDYLVQSFDHLVLEGLGLDQHPELREEYFKNYTRVMYLAQKDDAALRNRASWAAQSLGLPLVIKQTGYGNLEKRLKELLEK
jgi:hypothetical protein